MALAVYFSSLVAVVLKNPLLTCSYLL